MVYITGIRSYTNMGADEERKVYKEEVEIQKRVKHFSLNAKDVPFVCQCQTESQRVSGGVPKNSFIALQSKEGHNSSCPQTLCVPAWEDVVRRFIAMFKSRLPGKD